MAYENIAMFVMRGKEYLAALRPSGDVLALDTLLFADEVRDPHRQFSVTEAGNREITECSEPGCTDLRLERHVLVVLG